VVARPRLTERLNEGLSGTLGVVAARCRASLSEVERQAAPPGHWQARPVLATFVLWVMAFAVMRLLLPHAAADNTPAADLLQDLLSGTSFVGWLVILLVVLVAMRRAARPTASQQ
jgi:hypothetical protein